MAQLHVLRQAPAGEAIYNKQLSEAGPLQLALARLLQRINFENREDEGAERAKARIVDPGFTPAPLYLNQACEIAASPEYQLELLSLLGQLAKEQ